MNPLHIYEMLFRQHGPQGWWPAESAFEIMLGAVLTQHVAWTNAQRSIDRLRAGGPLTPNRIRSESRESLSAHIRPSRFFRAKARTLQALCVYLESYDDDISRLRSTDAVLLRKKLLAVHGIGPETADTTMLYAVGIPTFVVDSYAKQIFTRIGELVAAENYSHFQAWLMEASTV